MHIALINIFTPDYQRARKAMTDFIELCQQKNGVVQEDHIKALGMK